MKRRTTAIILAVSSATLALAIAILGNLVSDDLKARVQPYMVWVYGGLAVLFVVSIILLVWQMRQADGRDSVRINMKATNGGQVSKNKVGTPGAASVEVEMAANGKGSKVVDNTVEVGKAERT